VNTAFERLDSIKSSEFTDLLSGCSFLSTAEPVKDLKSETRGKDIDEKFACISPPPPL
jgi:hypothetical protein